MLEYVVEHGEAVEDSASAKTEWVHERSGENLCAASVAEAKDPL